MNNPLISFVVGLVVGAIAGALVYRKHRDRVEMLRAQGDLLVDMFKNKK